MAYLRYADATGCLRTRGLDVDRFVIGRAPTCQLAVDSEMISREHARIDRQRHSRYRLCDLDSRNKTYVNGELIRDTMLTPGSIIRVGDLLVEFVDEAATMEKMDLEFLTPDRQEPPDCEWIRGKAGLSLTIAQIEQLAQLFGDQPLTSRAEDIADAALGRVALDVQAERGFVALRGEGKTDLRPLALRALKRAAGASLVPVSQHFVFAPLLQGAAGRYPQTAAQLKEKLGYAAAAITAPLTDRGEVIGVLYVDRPAPRKPFPPGALQHVAAAAAQLGALIGETQRRLIQSAPREGAAWLATVRRLQGQLAAPIRTNDAFEAAVRLFSGRLRCGDFGTALPVDEHRCALLVCDGGGQGVTGLIQAHAVRAALETAIEVSEDAVADPAPVFNALNRLIAGSSARQILPSVFVGIDLSVGKLAYINAGGMAPLLSLAAGRLVTLDQVSLVLGVDPNYVYQTARVDLPESFRVMAHTDGWTDGTSAAGEPFGDQRLHEILLEPQGFGSAAETVTRLAQAWTHHMAGAQPEDDALLLVVARS